MAVRVGWMVVLVLGRAVGEQGEPQDVSTMGLVGSHGKSLSLGR